MSLLNKVLRDLDARHASELERQRVPANVKPLPPDDSRSVSAPKLLFVSAALLILLAMAGWLVFGHSLGNSFDSSLQQPTPQPVVAAESKNEPVPASAPLVPIVVAQVTEPAGVISQYELKLDMSGLSASNRPPEPKLAKDRTMVAALPNKEVSATSAMAVAEPKASGNIKGLPIKEFSNQGDDKTSKVIVSAQPGVHNDADYRRAASMIERGTKAEAEALLQQILIADPAYHAARQSLFNLLAASNRQDEAAALLVDGLRLNPTNTQWAMNLARLQVERNDNAAAWETLQRSLPYANSQGNYRAFCGTVLQRLNRLGEAEEHYRAALRINPVEGRWWVGLALTLEADNKSAESREAFSRAQATGTLPPDLAAFVDSKFKK